MGTKSMGITTHSTWYISFWLHQTENHIYLRLLLHFLAFSSLTLPLSPTKMLCSYFRFLISNLIRRMPHNAVCKAQRNQPLCVRHIHKMCPCWSTCKHTNNKHMHTFSRARTPTHSFLVFTYEQHFHYVQPHPKREAVVAATACAPVSYGNIFYSDNFSYFTLTATHLISFFSEMFFCSCS